jgi:hypothetical protein
VVGLEFTEHDFVAEAIIQDLMFYQQRERRERARMSDAGAVDGVAEIAGIAGPSQ